VRTMSMDAVLGELGWDRLDLLKLDIEGGEVELFAGGCAWLDRTVAIVGETHGAGTADLLRSALAPAGFDLRFNPANPRLFRAMRG